MEACGIWFDRNQAIFEDQGSFYQKISLHSLATQNSMITKYISNSSSLPQEVEIKKDTPWEFFNGVSPSDPPMGGVGGFFISTIDNVSFSLQIMDQLLITMLKYLSSTFSYN